MKYDVLATGGRKRGAMTQHAKWVLATTKAAQSCVDLYGGQIIRWDAVLQAVREDARPTGIVRMGKMTISKIVKGGDFQGFCGLQVGRELNGLGSSEYSINLY